MTGTWCLRSSRSPANPLPLAFKLLLAAWLLSVFALPAAARENHIVERAVLRDAGNMSAPTVFFVLDRVLRDGVGQVDLGLLALGPGFTVSALALRTPG